MVIYVVDEVFSLCRFFLMLICGMQLKLWCVGFMLYQCGVYSCLVRKWVSGGLLCRCSSGYSCLQMVLIWYVVLKLIVLFIVGVLIVVSSLLISLCIGSGLLLEMKQVLFVYVVFGVNVLKVRKWVSVVLLMQVVFILLLLFFIRCRWFCCVCLVSFGISCWLFGFQIRCGCSVIVVSVVLLVVSMCCLVMVLVVVYGVWKFLLYGILLVFRFFIGCVV